MTWRPLPVPDDEIPPKALKSSLNALVSKMGIPTVDELGAVFGRWTPLVGEQIAEHARPVALSDGVLVVEVDDQRWATQLKWLASGLVDRLNDDLGRASIERIDVRAPNSRRSLK